MRSLRNSYLDYLHLVKRIGVPDAVPLSETVSGLTVSPGDPFEDNILVAGLYICPVDKYCTSCSGQVSPFQGQTWYKPRLFLGRTKILRGR